MEKDLYFTNSRLISKLKYIFRPRFLSIFRYNDQIYKIMLKFQYGLMYKEN